MNRTVSIAVLIASLGLATLGGVHVYDRIYPDAVTPAVVRVDGVKIGRAAAPAILEAFASAWEAGMNDLDSGKDMTTAQSTVQSKFESGRIEALRAIVNPSFAKVIPEGTEPRDKEQRAEIVKFGRDFAKGLRGGK